MDDNNEDRTQIRSLRSQNDPEQSGSAEAGGGDAPPEYLMSRQSRKVALIVNNKFPKGKAPGFKKRNGTYVDCEKMKRLLSDLAFEGDDSPTSEIIERRDLDYNGMASFFKEASSGEFLQGAMCLVVVILSYGDEGYFYGMDSRMGVNKLINYFKADKCPPLAGKPKLFFLQTCTKEADTMEPQADGEFTPTMTLPIESDILLVQSCIPGRLTWATDPSQGSLFISTLAEVMTRYWRQRDVASMMTIVRNKLSRTLSENQITGQNPPYEQNTLLRDLFFK